MEAIETNRSAIEAKVKELEEYSRKLKFLDNQRENATLSGREKLFNENCKGKVFYYINPCTGGPITILKVNSCDSFGMYNSCNVTSIEIYPKHREYGGEGEQIRLKRKGTVRVDMLGAEYKLLTKEKLDELRETLDDLIDVYFAIMDNTISGITG